MAAGWILNQLGVGAQIRQVAITHCGKHWWVNVYRPPPKSSASPAFQVSSLPYLLLLKR